jgi:hypothetical protein
MTQPAAAPPGNSSAALTIFVGGLVAGTVDIGAACLINHVGPAVIMKAIAAGLYGKAAFEGGAMVAAIGLGLQWIMALIIAAIFVGVVRLLRWPRSRWAIAGIAAGPVIYVVMTFVVVPLSAAHGKMHLTLAGVAENLAAMVVFGLIVAGAWAWSGRAAK